ncbi:MAG: class I SAM-dependent methyltransferase [Candidatus Latescibacterota bacterium]
MSKRVKRQFPEESWDAFYRRYQSILAEKYLIPVLRKWGVDLAGQKLLEVGSGDGGCSAAFHRAGCEVTSMDIDQRLVRIAGEFNQREGLEIHVSQGDVCDESSEALQKGPFDIIMLRDVIEHIADPAGAMKILKRRLRSRGVLFVVFPPYYSPFGAHQQILPRKKLLCMPYNKLPYIQLLPDAVFLPLVKGDSPQNREVIRLREIRLTIRRFERAARNAELPIRARKLYLSRPTFALRYGLPVLGASLLGALPIINELAVTAAYYLLENRK